MIRRLALVAGAALIGGLGFLVLRPSPMPQDAPMVTVSVPQLDTEAQAGKRHFQAHCAQCHGQDGAGRVGVGPPLVHVIYEPSHHGDGSFYAAVQLGVRQHHWSFGDMPRQPQVTEPEIAQIISYVRALQRANGIF